MELFPHLSFRDAYRLVIVGARNSDVRVAGRPRPRVGAPLGITTMRTRSSLLTALFALLPATAFAQDPAPEKVELQDEKPADKPANAQPEAAPAAPAAAPETKTEAAAGGQTKAEGVVTMEGGAGATTNGATAGAAVTTSTSQRGPDSSGGSDEWKFDYHGYFRAPMRIGIGKRELDAGHDGTDNPELDVDGASSTTLHAPIIPDDQFLSFQSTPHNKKDWAEMFFTIGNSWASGTVSIQGYNFAEAAWNDTNTQFGISQGYVDIHPDLGYENVRLNLRAGAFSDKYGQAGRYDAGEYDTYLFGRTHVAGETLHVDFDLNEAWTLYVEHGIGTKRPDPSHFNNARFTILNHAHVGLKQGRDLEFGAHYMAAWTQEDDRDYSVGPAGAPTYADSRVGLPDGKLWVAGVEARAELGAFGYIYGGFSHIGGDYAVSVAPAIEVLNAFGGGQFQLGVTDNYFDAPGCEGFAAATPPAIPAFINVGDNTAWNSWGPDVNGCSDGNGSINAIEAQYEFSLTNFLQQSSGGQRFWGEGQDVVVKLYGIYAMVSSESVDTTIDDLTQVDTANPSYDVNKLKFGVDALYAALPWLSGAVRFDRVQPNSNIPEQSFSILSPRIVFKSKWVTREQISLQYSRYMYNRRDCDLINDTLPFRCVQSPAAPSEYEGFGSNFDSQETGNRAVGPNTGGGAANSIGVPGVMRPDVNVIKLEASMWW